MGQYLTILNLARLWISDLLTVQFNPDYEIGQASHVLKDQLYLCKSGTTKLYSYTNKLMHVNHLIWYLHNRQNSKMIPLTPAHLVWFPVLECGRPAEMMIYHFLIMLNYIAKRFFWNNQGYMILMYLDSGP